MNISSFNWHGMLDVEALSSHQSITVENFLHPHLLITRGVLFPLCLPTLNLVNIRT